MKIDEAIERNKDLVHKPNDVNDTKDRKAIQLGIEALERHQYNSTARFGEYDYSPLPSETEGEK